MKFCTGCGSKVIRRITVNEDRERSVCPHCDTVFYSNPKVIVGCLAHHQDRVLLCQRAIEPGKGLWTLPAGFMEDGESTAEGAARETWEEARARVDNMHLYRVIDAPTINQVYILYRCVVVNGDFGVGLESKDAGLYMKSEIPWDELAFSSVSEILRQFYLDLSTGAFPVKAFTLEHVDQFITRDVIGSTASTC
jgi:ADP-ribose pyrophosphatase YjhB (NUDIX family)